jgi:sugar phosphate isomerase/epimerase
MLSRSAAAALPLLAAPAALFAGDARKQQSRLGLGAYSCGIGWRMIREGQAGPKFKDTLSFLDYASSLGAAGVQTLLRPNDEQTAVALRERVEKSGAYYEGEILLPKDEADLARFESDLRRVRATGATIARCAALGSRRYETFKTQSEFDAFRSRTESSLASVEPLLRKTGIRLAIENHKDWLVAEQIELLRRFSSEWVGVCLDTGNNIALLEDPTFVVDSLAPLALTVHLKDMAVMECEEGFLLSEVPLGTGFLDLSRLVNTLRRAKPGIVFNLEMITRDPLKIPCLMVSYWATFGGRETAESAATLGSALRLVKQHPPKSPLPKVTGKTLSEQLAFEEENNRNSISFARANLRL